MRPRWGPNDTEQRNPGFGNDQNVEALPVLLQGLDDRDAAVRRQAAHALNGLEDPQAVDALLRTLHDPNPMVVATAVAALASSRVQRAELELLRLMGRRVQPGWARGGGGPSAGWGTTSRCRH